MRWSGLLWIGLAALSAAAMGACDGSAGSSGGGGDADDGGGAHAATGTTGAAGTTGADAATGATAATSVVTAGVGGAGGSGGGPGNPGLPTLGTLVVLGDSISDGGGQGPFYYNLLRDKLETKYGAIAYHRQADSGSKTGALVGQIADLPSTLPGPVAVAITSGGNDMKDALPQIVAGTDQAARTTMGNNIAAALADLTEPGQFGAGVEVFVFEANIYDASDGDGDFGQNGCAFGQGLPAIPTDAFFANWNGEIATRVSAAGQTLMDMHGYFDGHGYDGSPSWYAGDCTHPNTLGHAALAEFFYAAIAGDGP